MGNKTTKKVTVTCRVRPEFILIWKKYSMYTVYLLFILKKSLKIWYLQLHYFTFTGLKQSIVPSFGNIQMMLVSDLKDFKSPFCPNRSFYIIFVHLHVKGFTQVAVSWLSSNMTGLMSCSANRTNDISNLFFFFLLLTAVFSSAASHADCITLIYQFTDWSSPWCVCLLWCGTSRSLDPSWVTLHSSQHEYILAWI